MVASEQRESKGVDPHDEGRRLLKAGMARLGLSQRRLARILGVDASCVCHWLGGPKGPQLPHLRAALERLMGIPQEVWMTAEEKDVVARATSAAPATGEERLAPSELARLADQLGPADAREIVRLVHQRLAA
jgi:plasmid maintenance system antidote protein VapI